MNGGAISTVLHIITDPSNISWACFIFGFFFAMISLLGFGKFSISKDLRDVITKISASGIRNRSEGSTDKGFKILDSIITNNRSLHHPWHEFKENLICEREEFERNGEILKVDVHKNAIEAEKFFNYDSIIINSDRWALGIKSGVFDTVPNILTGMGILGTFIGIVVGLPDLSVGSSGLEAEMAKFVNGMKIAFGTSILGLFLALIFSFFEKWAHDRLEHRISKFSEKIDLLFTRKSEQEYLLSISKEVARNHDALLSLSDNIGKKVAEGFQSLGIDSVKLDESIKTGIQTGINKFSNDLQDIVKKQEQLNLVSSHIIEIFKEVKNGMEATNSNLKNQNETISITTSGLGQIAETIKNINNELVPQMQGNINLTTNLLNASKETTLSLDRLAAEKDRISNQYASMLTAIQGAATGLSSSFDAYQSKSNTVVEGSLQAFDKELARGVQKLSGVLVDMGSLTEDIRSIHESIRNQYNNMQKSN